MWFKEGRDFLIKNLIEQGKGRFLTFTGNILEKFSPLSKVGKVFKSTGAAIEEDITEKKSEVKKESGEFEDIVTGKSIAIFDRSIKKLSDSMTRDVIGKYVKEGIREAEKERYTPTSIEGKIEKRLQSSSERESFSARINSSFVSEKTLREKEETRKEEEQLEQRQSHDETISNIKKIYDVLTLRQKTVEKPEEKAQERDAISGKWGALATLGKGLSILGTGAGLATVAAVLGAAVVSAAAVKIANDTVQTYKKVKTQQYETMNKSVDLRNKNIDVQTATSEKISKINPILAKKLSGKNEMGETLTNEEIASSINPEDVQTPEEKQLVIESLRQKRRDIDIKAQMQYQEDEVALRYMNPASEEAQKKSKLLKMKKELYRKNRGYYELQSKIEEIDKTNMNEPKTAASESPVVSNSSFDVEQQLNELRQMNETLKTLADKKPVNVTQFIQQKSEAPLYSKIGK